MAESEQKTEHLSLTGLYTAGNPFTKAPDGSAEILDNVLCREPGMVEPRRGFSKSVVNPSGAISRLFPWAGSVLAVAGSGDVRSYTDAGGWSSSRGTFSPPDSTNPMRFASANKSLFFTTSTGVKVMDALTSSAIDAGMPVVAYLTATTSTSGSTFLAASTSCAYRVLVCKYDVSNKLIVSTPSPRIVVTNPSGSLACNVTVTIELPVNGVAQGATFVQLYRTMQSTTPGDECFLVQEHKLTSADIAGLTFSFSVDIAPDSSLTPPLYTNAQTAQGIVVANDLPPLARDLVGYNGRLLLFNTTERHSVSLQLIGTTGLVSGTSTFVVAGVSYLASASENVGLAQFQLFTAGTASQNIENTARSLCRTITGYNFNNSAAMSPSVVALYTSGATDAPGMMTLQTVNIGTSAFTVTVGQSGQTCWVPDLSVNTTILTSDNDRSPAKFWWSNLTEPHGVPHDNNGTIGAADKAILRAILVRSTVFVFKEDGLFTITGSDAPYTVSPLDPGLVLLAPESARVLDDQIFCWTNRGAVYVSESGVSPAISDQVSRDLSFLQAGASDFYTTSFAVPYEDEGLWVFAMPASNGDVGCSTQYVFNTKPTGWSRWTIPNVIDGCLDPAAQRLTLAVGSTLWLERRAFTSADFQDPGFSIACPQTGSRSLLTFPTTTHGIGVGDIITQSGAPVLARVTAVSGAAVTLDTSYTFSAAALSVSKSIACTMRPQVITAGDPVREKRWDHLYLTFKRAEFPFCTIGFDANTTGTQSATRVNTVAQAWGTFPWGMRPWGMASGNVLLRADPPQAAAACAALGVTLTVQAAQSFWQFSGFGLLYTPGTNTPVR